MSIRLNAKEAAALTEQRARQIEARAKLDEQDRKLQAAQAVKHARLWRAQGNRLIEAALNGDGFLRVGTNLIGGDKLIALGFVIAYVDQASFLEHQRQVENERVEQEDAEARAIKETETARNLELKKLQPYLDKKISDFIKLVEKEDRYSGMDSTRKMVVAHFKDVIKDYAESISAGISHRDVLFSILFNSQLFVYKPIDSLRPIVQALQDALHKVETIRRDLPEVEVYEIDDFQNDLDDIDDEGDDEENLGIDEFKRYLEPWQCHESMEVDDSQDYYQIEWCNLDEPVECKFEDLISAAALAWLCGEIGQGLLEAIESEIQTAINSASSSIQISIERDEEQCSFVVGGVTYCDTPSSDQLSDILKILKYKTQDQSHVDGKSLLEISW